MTDLHSQLDHLPAEIWNEILKEATLKDLCNLALVCKTWLYPSQLLLYSNVTIGTIPQLQKFYNAVENNTHLATFVKTFRLIFDKYVAQERYIDTVSSLLYKFLPNMEELQLNCLPSYKPILDALLNSKLTRLKSIDGPGIHDKCEEEDYINCALLMKNRIERLTIAANMDFVDKKSCEKISFNHLYNTLYQFVNLTSINVRVQTNEEIQVLEHIVESCKFLKEIKCHFSLITSAPSNANFSIAAIHNLTPRMNIKYLTFESYEYLDEKKYIYIMHKFPQLERFNSDTAKWGFYHRLSQDALTQLLLFLLKIKNAHVGGIELDGDTIGKAFQHVWNSTSIFGSEEVKIIYPYAYYSSNVRISISKSEIEKTTQLEILPEPSGGSLFRILKGIGKYLKKMDIYNKADYDSEFEFSQDGGESEEIFAFPKNGMEHITKYCPNLKYLHFQECYFEPSEILSVEANGSLSLDELSFHGCIAEDDVLKQFSQLISNIKKLTIISNSFDEIIMPYTKIDSLIINFGVYPSNYLYIKILTLCTNVHYYYRLNCENHPMAAEDSNVEEYENADKYARFHICCQTKPILEII